MHFDFSWSFKRFNWHRNLIERRLVITKIWFIVDCRDLVPKVVLLKQIITIRNSWLI